MPPDTFWIVKKYQLPVHRVSDATRMRLLLKTALILQDRLLIKPEELKLHAGPSKVID